MTIEMCGSISPGLIVTEGKGIDAKLDKADQITKALCESFSYQVKATTSTDGKITVQPGGSLQLKGSILNINITLLSSHLGLELDTSLGMCLCSFIINAVKL